ncbi:tyrosine-type recombinase/integrase [Salmonella enterica]|uniref:Tyrosine-type recombinase/integrase n=1 Tax=Salmonella enterica subsp. enterica serovar Ank TaxID=1173578 RepID=A0A5I2X5V5_SALET|nr:site-specific integrase [Salmonella enterica]EBY9282865.1 site-specific integrase [Salmonella enterica subsp. enterica serovar Denver]ECF3885260.1 site-specific integrase [Salmonella enterica subsp. enterica serovar Ank]ECD5427986.1 site-specific integrase [Salmonella enterica subsp. enterica serovar Denver]QGR31518.1 tyrosine-type recombinase/integrase [Salmonella enterica]HAE1791660.1 tyrosine-type recombinase/integrase [Salmonella enterica subsp. enterica serovar Ank]
METNITWQQLIDEYFFAKPLRSASEWSYTKVFKSFVHYMGPLSCPNDVTYHKVLAWRRFLLKEKKLSGRTWNNKVAHMRAIFNYGIQRELLHYDENPFNNSVVKPDKKRKKTLTQAQIEYAYQIMEQYENQENTGLGLKYSRCALFPAWFWLTVLDTLYYTGIRQNQLLHIRLNDVDLREGQIRLITEGCKNHKEHYVPVISFLRPRLTCLMEKAQSEGLKGNDRLFNIALFTGKDPAIGDDMDSPQVRAFFRRLSRECQFAISPHRFRHTLATEMMKMPEQNLHMAQSVLGHSNMKSTLEYVENDIAVMGRALEAQFMQIKAAHARSIYSGLTKNR